MTFVSLGDVARTLVTNRQSAALRTDMQRLTQELGAGRRAEIPGDASGPLAALAHRLTLLDGQSVALRETASFFAAAQDHLDHIARRTGDLGRQVAALGAPTPGSTVPRMGEAARQTLDDLVGALNAGQGGRALFAGVATTGAPVIPAADLMERAAAVASGVTSADELETRITAWFADPGGFRAEAYRGADRALAPFDLGGGVEVTQDLRADDPALVALLRDTVLIALAGSATTGIPLDDRARLQARAAQSILGGEGSLIARQEALGVAQERIDRQQARAATEIAALRAARTDLLAADPFETALALQDAQNRLDAFYTATARTARLGLAAFLR